MDEMLKQKVAIITKDLDSGYLVFNRFAANLMTMRGWSLPLVLAYMALLINNNATNLWALAPLGVVLLLFIYLEAGDRRDMDAIRTDICKVQQIFMESDEKKFTERVAQYQFRESRRLDGASRLVSSVKGVWLVWPFISFIFDILFRKHKNQGALATTILVIVGVNVVSWFDKREESREHTSTKSIQSSDVRSPSGKCFLRHR